VTRIIACVACLTALPATASAALPTIDYTLTGPAGLDGWYVGPVTINWTITNATGSVCTPVETLYDDTAGTTRTCTATNGGDMTTAQTKVVKIDQTPPAGVLATAQRPPDHGAFYTAPLAITWSGTDATSGIASCTTTTYAGPDATSAAPTGSCRDRAGNLSPLVPLPFSYDATAPTLTDVAATVAPDRTATLRWTPGADAQSVTVARGATVLLNAAPATTRTLTDGPLAPATTNTYTITVADAAGNATAATTTASAPALAATTAAATKGKAQAATRPTLRWKRQAGAKYYNLQLFRNGRKILSAWPKTNQYTLKATWRYRGHTYKLTSGRYRWYVWPGYGPRTRHRYGRLHAKGALTYPAPPIRDGGQ
jgi:hypothetical protein